MKLAWLALAGWTVSGASLAQPLSSSAGVDFPGKLIRVIHPAARGGNSDLFSIYCGWK